MKDLILSRIERAKLLLYEASDAISAKKVADMAKATEFYAARQKSEESADAARAIYAEALKLEGEFLQNTPKAPAGRPRKIGSRREPITKTLKQQEIGKKESATAQAVAFVAEEEPELFKKFKNRKTNLAALKRYVKKRVHEAKKVRSKIHPKLPPKGPFELILADPPWRYEHSEADSRKIENQYPTATLDQIKGHAPDSAKDSILMLWTTAPKLDQGIEVLTAWGYTYRTCAVWDKEVMGMGYWFRIQTEFLLIGVKGKPACTPESERISNIFRSKRAKHSEKPKIVYEWIERAFPELSKLEMYCRKPRKGWASWGNE